MCDCTPVVIESQPDWLTCAAHTAQHQLHLTPHLPVWLQAEEAAGNRVRPFRLMGYEGHRCGRVQYGFSERGTIVRLSGDLADRHLLTCLENADSVTRLDVAVTVRTPHYDPSLALEHYGQALTHHADHEQSAEPTLIQRADRGATLYVGRRGSAYYLRCYNKQGECEDNHDEAGAEHYRNCWRYELEITGPDSALCARTLATSSDRHALCQDWTYDWCERHGVRPIFPRQGSAALQPGFRRRSDAQSRLMWVEKRVAPALAWLSQHGYAQQVRGMLPPDVLVGNGHDAS